ncbi:hypothetical protein C2845_PM08G02380 [Panicum miliaceum]|uniref:Uncharacterized protein n=1 Tax=Panicum miliaceum TaxID=4540 RepID=A0A3L6R0X4_PANMI|nr:hypothetical protein C2845_PM08G02380 [Panicum miliaceum]
MGRWDTTHVFGVASPGIRVATCFYGLCQREEAARRWSATRPRRRTPRGACGDPCLPGVGGRASPAAVVDDLSAYYFNMLWGHEMALDFAGACSDSVAVDKDKSLLRYKPYNLVR